MPNSATLVQALGAAFCAILCALSGMGGGGMMIGARTAAWTKSGAPLPYDAELEYVTFNEGTCVVVYSGVLIEDPDIEIDVWGNDYDISSSTPYLNFISTQSNASPWGRCIALVNYSGDRRVYYGGNANAAGNYVSMDGYSKRHKFRTVIDNDSGKPNLYVDGVLIAKGDKSSVRSIRYIKIGKPSVSPGVNFGIVPFKFYGCKIIKNDGETWFISPVIKDDVPYLFFTGDGQLKSPIVGTITAGPILT